MIKNIGLKGFKAFSELKDLKLKPVTVLCGQNSSGKSSILQAILLMKQTRESRNLAQSILLNGKYVHLGSIGNVLYGGVGRSEISIEYEISKNKISFEDDSKVRFGISIDYLVGSLVENGRELYQKGNSFNIKVKYLFGPAMEQGNARGGQAEIIDYSVVVVVFDVGGNEIAKSFFNINKSVSAYNISWKGLSDLSSSKKGPLDGSRENINVDFENMSPVIRKISGLDDTDKGSMPFGAIIYLKAIDEIVSYLGGLITYLGPLREEPARRYFFDNEVVDIGVKGENAAYIYQLQGGDILRHHFFYSSSDGGKFEKKDLSTVGRALNEWMEILGIKDFSSEDKNDVISLGMSSRSNVRVSIADVGFGISQIFPVILEGLRMPKGGTLLLEQPEIHLHPNMQMQMADYFISLALSGKNIIVETHSDHVVNRLIRRIVEDESLGLKDLISIYFVSGGDKGSTAESIEVDDNLGIVNWPKGFFDQTANEQRKIIQASIKKKKNKYKDG